MKKNKSPYYLCCCIMDPDTCPFRPRCMFESHCHCSVLRTPCLYIMLIILDTPIYKASTAGQAGKELTCPSVISGMTSEVYLHFHLGRFHSNVGVVSDVSTSNRCIAGRNEASCGKPNVASPRTPSYKLYTRVSNTYVLLCFTST